MENPFAVITGASIGIGFELAKQFGSHGYNLLIVAGTDAIFEAQEELEELGYEVEAIKANLATYAGVENLYNQIEASGRAVDVLVVNAGVGVSGPFLETDLREEINLINLNIVSVVHLTKLIARDMKQMRKGKILFTSSIASQMPSTFEAVYGASKSFVSSFAESLRNELKDSGITITILMPGANESAKVAEQGYEALVSGKERVFSESFMTKLQGMALKVLPVKAKAQFHKKLSEPQIDH